MSRLTRQIEALTRELEALEGAGLHAHDHEDGGLVVVFGPCDESCSGSGARREPGQDHASAPTSRQDATSPPTTSKTSAGGSSKRRKPIDPKKASEP